MLICPYTFKAKILELLGLSLIRSKGFCQIKINPKIREKLGSGWVGGLSPNTDFFFLENCVFFVFFVMFSCFQMFPKKIKNWIGGGGGEV